MKRYAAFLILALGGGAAGFVLRLLQWRTGFEADTGLPIAGNLFGPVLVVLAAAGAAACLLLGKALPAGTESGLLFPEGFSTTDAAVLTPAVAGIFLMAASGLADAAAGLDLGVIPGLSQAVSRREQLILGLLTAAAAVCLLPAAAACRRRNRAVSRPFSGMPLLISVVCLVVRLVLVYRQDSVDPSLEAYWVELVALVLVILALYRLSSFAYGVGRTRRFVLYAVPGILLCMAALADGRGLSAALFYAGGALVLTGFLLLRLAALSHAGDVH